MNHFTRFIALSFIVLAVQLQGAANQTSPYISIRSQGADAARTLVGQTNHINLFDFGYWYASGSLTTEYTKSFNSVRMAQCLFGTDLLGKESNCRSIKISGSGVENRGDTDWLADYFGLPRDYQSTLSFCPRIENVVADFNFYLGLDNWVRGLWFQCHAPLTYTKWNLNFTECVNNAGVASHHPGYFNGFVVLGAAQTSDGNTAYPNAYGVAHTELVDTFNSFACNNAVPNLGNKTQSVALPTTTNGNLSGSGATFNGVTFNPLCRAQFSTGSCSETTRVGLADFQFALGWNAFQNEQHHLGFGLRASAPTGNAPKGITVFEPIVGNGNHWEFGVLLTSHMTLWQSADEYQQLGIFFDANVTHLFKAEQARTFDLKDKGNSRYMLAQKMTDDVENLRGSSTAGANPIASTVPVAQFALEYTPVANLTTLKVDVSASVQADMVLMFAYQRGGFVWDLGYNLWLRSCEKIDYDCTCRTPFTDGRTWVLKGDGQVYGYAAEDDASNGVPLSASQSNATIHGGTNQNPGGKSGTTRATQNPNVDNAQYATTTGGVIILDNPNTQDVPEAGVAGLQVCTSVNPVFLSDCDIDFDGARTKGLSHKLFTHISFTWEDYRERWEPYLGCGAFGEFFARTKDCNIDCSGTKVTITDECDRPCNRCGVSQWGVWVKGGISFQ